MCQAVPVYTTNFDTLIRQARELALAKGAKWFRDHLRAAGLVGSVLSELTDAQLRDLIQAAQQAE